MADAGQVVGDRVYCHLCEHEWDRSQGGLQCPECRSEFVEVIEPSSTSDQQPSPLPETAPPVPSHPIHGSMMRSPPPIPSHPLHNHNPWAGAPDPDEDDITTIEFNTGRGHGTVSYTSRTYTIGGNGRGRDPAADDIARDFQSMLTNILGNGRDIRGQMFYQFPSQNGARAFGAQPSTGSPSDPFSMLFPTLPTNRQPPRLPRPFDILGMLLSMGSGQFGDAVTTDEAFDRVMTQLMEQNQGNGAPPASEAAISALKKKPVDKEMMGSDGTAECSICMDNVEIGDEVTFLPCNHWFHGDCVVSWLKEHDTCPHCRQPISTSDDTNQPATPAASPRRRSRRSSSIASPFARSPQEEPARYGPQVIDSPSGLREARQRYYGNSRSYDEERPHSARNSSSRSDRGSEHGQGGVGGWIRSRMPF